MKRLLTILAVLLSLTLVAAACGSDDDDDAASDDADTTQTADDTADDTAVDTADDSDDEAMAEHLGDGSLGEVTVEAGAEIQIRSLNAITGDVAFLGVPNERGVAQTIEDYGPIKGFDVTMGTGLDDLCSADGGQAAAQTIVADEQVIGVIGTSCSGAATAAAPLISEAGMVMISPSNTSPALTSDQQGNAGDNYNVGYYRTAHNDLFQGAAMAEFVFNQLGLTTAAAMHDGDPYTEGLAAAFTNAFEELGGTVTGFVGVAKEDTDMVPALTEIAAGSPEALFFPIFQPAGDFIADQAPGVSGLEDTQLIAADGLLVDGFLELEQTEGMFFSGPDTRFGQNTNQSTGSNAEDFLATYEANNGEAPSAAFWGHSYDATALLLDAISAASFLDGDNLVIDRAGVREFLNNVRDYEGIIGTINCDDFGDCGSQRITVIQHLDSSDIEASKLNVVYEYAPTGSSAAGAISAGDEGTEGWPEKLVFGFVPSQEQESLQDDIQPFIDVLEEGLGIEVEGVVTTDYTGLVTAMGTGTADLGAFGPFGYTLGADTFGNIEALIQSVRFGSPTYHGQWFTNDASICAEPPVEATALENVGGEVVQVGALDAVALQVGVFFGDDGKALGEVTDEDDPVGADVPISAGYSCIGDLNDVAGKTIAFTTETSTSGYLFPAGQLTALDIDPSEDVTPIFTGGHDAAVVSVYNGDADVGLSFDDARRTLRGEETDVGEKVIVFAITDEIPNDVVAIRSDLPDTLKDAIYDAVEAFLGTDEGEEIFDAIYGWTDVRRAVEADFDIVRDAAIALDITEPPG